MGTKSTLTDNNPTSHSKKSAADDENKSARRKTNADNDTAKTSGDKTAEETAYQPIFANVAKYMCMNGAAPWLLAQAFKVDEKTIREWTRTYKDFGAACKYGMKFADHGVERSLYQLALGYDFIDVKVFRYRGEVIYAPYTKHVVGSVRACIFWLINRQPDNWSLNPKPKPNAEDNGPLKRLYAAICGTKLMPNEDQTAWLEREDYPHNRTGDVGVHPKEIDAEKSNED